MEEVDDNSNDDEASVVKMEVDPPLKMKGKGTSDHPLDLTSDSNSDKENDRDHPGPTWMRYDRTNPEHYCIDIPDVTILGHVHLGYLFFLFFYGLPLPFRTRY